MVTLQSSELASHAVHPWTARLRYAYADALLAVGRENEARDWFAKALEADHDGTTDASDRLAQLDGVEFVDVFDGEAAEDDDQAAPTAADAEADTADDDAADDDLTDDDVTDEDDLEDDEEDEGDLPDEDEDGDDPADADADSEADAKSEAPAAAPLKRPPPTSPLTPPRPPRPTRPTTPTTPIPRPSWSRPSASPPTTRTDRPGSTV